MAKANIMDALGDIAREKGINRDRLAEVIQEAVTAAAKRKYKQFNDVEARINNRTGELEVFQYKTVAAVLTDPNNQIPLAEAKSLDSLAEEGDEVEYEIDNAELSRVIAQTARQLIFQKIREVEREATYENFKDRVGEILHGTVSRTERNRVFITFGKTEAILYRREQIPSERYSGGENIRCVLLDVLNDPREPSQLVISRADPQLLIKLFEMEVPEIYDGIVEIVAAAREPGRRAKVAVRSNDTDVDPVGACVGMRGSRVQAIISELRGEKIDIINFSEDIPSYTANALAPAELSRIKIDEEENVIDVEVEQDQLSMAIGRQGQNVRLASKLLDFKINVTGSEKAPLTLEEQIRERLLASQAELAKAEGEGNSGEALAAAEAAMAAAMEAAGISKPEDLKDLAEGLASTEGAPAEDDSATDAAPSEASPPEDATSEEPVEEQAAAETENKKTETPEAVPTEAEAAPPEAIPVPEEAPQSEPEPVEEQVEAEVMDSKNEKAENTEEA